MKASRGSSWGFLFKGMLPKTHRLTAERDFAQLFKYGKTFYGQGLALKVGKNTVGRTRVGFVVSTKVAKRAVVRNRLKRQLREAVGKYLPQLAPGYDAAFLTKRESLNLTFDQIVSICGQLFKRAGLL